MSYALAQPDALAMPSERAARCNARPGCSLGKQTAMATTRSNREKSLGTLSPMDVPIQQLPVVELSAEHIRRSGELAVDRNESYDRIDGGSVFGKQDSLTSHQIGILGEMAVAELYGSDIDTKKYPFGDTGIDLELWGTTADIKSTTTDKMRYPELLICSDNDLTAEIYFITHILNWGPNGARIRILGYGTREQIENTTPRRHPGTRKNHVITPENLTLPPLVEYCNG